MVFHPGQRVVCINADFNGDLNKYFQNFPKEGYAYTIKEVRPPELGNGVTLEEVENQIVYYENHDLFMPPAFHASRFIHSSGEDFPCAL